MLQATEHPALFLRSRVHLPVSRFTEKALAPADSGLGYDLKDAARGDLDEAREVRPG